MFREHPRTRAHMMTDYRRQKPVSSPSPTVTPMRTLVAVAAFIALAPLAGAQTPDSTTTLPLKTTRTVKFTTDEGTWMSVDLSPDGRTIVFDLFGDLYS